MYKYLLFDLDGTLTDPKVGITKAVAYALKKFKQLDVDLDALTKFIGPPLKDSFMRFYGFSEQDADLAIQYYREYFSETGIFENEVYPGIRDMLDVLKHDGRYVLAVATSKPTVFAERIIEHFGLKDYFTCVVGSNLDGTRSKKAEVIQEVLRVLNVSQLDEVVMIGDREHDILGAKQVGVRSIGVLYGYGSYEELEAAGAGYIVKQVEQLRILLEQRATDKHLIKTGSKCLLWD